MAVDRVRFVGECVALVVAETRAAAYDALELIDVAYEPLPAVVDEEAAIADGAPQLHENIPNNITTYFKTGGGDYAAAVRQADQMLRLRLVNNRLIPTCLETRAILAEPGVDDGLTLYLPSQVPHMHRRWIAETVGIPEHLLRVVAPDIGGGFGAKMHLYPEELLCAWLARELKSPVKWWESRSESHQATSHGRAHTELIEAACWPSTAGPERSWTPAALPWKKDLSIMNLNCRKMIRSSSSLPSVEASEAPPEVSQVISAAPLDIVAMLSSAHHPAAGAVVLFSGEVRDHNKGREVAYLEYEAYHPLATKMIHQILAEAKEKWGLQLAIARHRVGRLTIGEPAVIVITAAAHRPFFHRMALGLVLHPYRPN